MLKATIESKISELQAKIEKQNNIIIEASQLIEKSTADKVLATNNVYMLHGAVQAYQDMLNQDCQIDRNCQEDL